MHVRRFSAIAAVCVALVMADEGAPTAQSPAGALTITSLGTPSVQDFNGLVTSGSATWTNDGTIPGWYHTRTGTGTTIVANDGGSNAGNLYSYGATSATERALGSIGSGNAAAGSFHWGVRVANGTGATITSLTVAYTGEQWRNSAAPAQTIDFSYRMGSGLGTAVADFTTGGVAVPELAFTSPITGGTASAINGNTAGNRTELSHTIAGLSLAPGQEILLRWTDVDHAGSDHGLAIDDFAITANGGGAPTVSINDVSVVEGNSGTLNALFTVSVSTGVHGGVTFNIATADGSGPAAATLADGDYVARVETDRSIPPGATTYAFPVVINGDVNVEPDETFFVNLSAVSGATLLDSQGAGTIATDDAPPPVASDVVISQIYGGGGNAGATLTHDFIELFNSGTTPVNLTGWSLQYLSAAGSGTWAVTPLSGTIAAGGYFLVGEAQGSGGTTGLPAQDATGTIPLSATAGKVALLPTTTAAVGSCPAGATVDLVGYGTASCFEGTGPAAATTNTTALLRKRGGCYESDNNNIDFSPGAPAPRNSATPPRSCIAVPAAIHDIQGSGLSSPLAGQDVIASGIVTGVKSNGFFLQAPDSAWDSNPATSEALFVFSGAAPAVAVSDAVSARGTVSEFFGLTQVESTLPGDVTVDAAGAGVPAATPLTPGMLDPAGSLSQLERLEAMRLHAASLISVAPTNTFGETDAVFPGVARPMREPGIEVSQPVPPDPSSGVADCCIPRWDENPERIMIDSDGLVGAPVMSVTSNVTIASITGPLDFTFDRYKLLPEAPPSTTANMSGIPVPMPAPGEFTVAGFNIENFASNETRRRKAALAIRQLMRSPDVIGHIEILDLATLQSLADQVNDDAVAAGEPDPAYEAALIPAPAGGTQNVGFLVKTSRVRIDSVTQERGAETYTNPLNGQPETLHDRPPLVLRGTVDPLGANPRPLIVIVNHLRSFIDIELVGGDGLRVRAKRTAQAESLAGLLQELQTADATTPIVSVGDYNAYQFNDGHTDPIAVIKGTPTPDDQVVVDESPDLVTPNYVDLTDTLPPAERYSFIFEGTPQALDHVIVNTVAQGYMQRYAIARGNADFPEQPDALFAGDVTRPERSSDHDMPVAYFRFLPPSADLALTLTASTTTAAVGASVTYTATVTNRGASAAQNVVVTANSTTTTFSTLAAGASEIVTFMAPLTCTVPHGSAVVTSASVRSDTSDPNPGNNTASASVTAANAVPVISGATVDRPQLLSPLHQMVLVTVNYSASDTCGPVTTKLRVKSDEPVTGRGQGVSGLTSPDWELVDEHHVRLRSERSSRGDGRVYTITIGATDTAGGIATQNVVVTVPRHPRDDD